MGDIKKSTTQQEIDTKLDELLQSVAHKVTERYDNKKILELFKRNLLVK